MSDTKAAVLEISTFYLNVISIVILDGLDNSVFVIPMRYSLRPLFRLCLTHWMDFPVAVMVESSAYM